MYLIRRIFSVLFGAILLGTYSANALARWVYVDKVLGDSHFTVYHDPDKVKPSKFGQDHWILFDRERPRQLPNGVERSSILNVTVSCKEEKLSINYVAQYTGRLGSGEVIGAYDLLKSNGDKPEWQFIPPGSIWYAVYRAACLK